MFASHDIRRACEATKWAPTGTGGTLLCWVWRSDGIPTERPADPVDLSPLVSTWVRHHRLPRRGRTDSPRPVYPPARVYRCAHGGNERTEQMMDWVQLPSLPGARRWRSIPRWRRRMPEFRTGHGDTDAAERDVTRASARLPALDIRDGRAPVYRLSERGVVQNCCDDVISPTKAYDERKMKLWHRLPDCVSDSRVFHSPEPSRRL
jgi:hypothetical protein